MSERYGFRLSPDLKEKIERDFKEMHLTSMNVWLLKASEHFLQCKKAYQAASMRLIVLKYAGNCIKCGARCEAGDYAWYGRGVGVICLDCSVLKGMGDKALVAKYLKSREYKMIVNALKAEADRLADKVELYTTADKMDALFKQSGEIEKTINDYLKKVPVGSEELKALEDVKRLTKETREVVSHLETFFEKRLKRKIKKKAYEA